MAIKIKFKKLWEWGGDGNNSHEDGRE